MSAQDSGKSSPAWILFFLAPLVGELLTGSTPPYKFLNPLTWFFLLALYGVGAVVAREITVRVGRGWPTLLVLSAAFVLLKEGVMTASLFNPNLPGPLTFYGRFLGVNWVWGVQSVIFQTVFGFALPILLVNLFFPQRRYEPWVNTPGATWLGGLLFGGLLLGFFFLAPYHPTLPYYLITIGLAVFLIISSLGLPQTFRVTRNVNVADPYIFGALSFLATLFFVLLSWLLPRTPIPAPATILCLIAVAFYAGRTILAMSGNAKHWHDRHQAALATGALAFFALLAPFKEWFSLGLNGRGMTFVAVGTVIFLVGLNWLTHTRKVEQRFLTRY